MLSEVRRLCFWTVPIVLMLGGTAAAQSGAPFELTAKPQQCAHRGGAEVAFPCQKGEPSHSFLQMADGSLQPITFERFGHVAVFEGDILLNIDDRGFAVVASNLEAEETKSSGRALEVFRWPNETVFFTIDPTLPNQGRVNGAIVHWEYHTAVDFVPRTIQADFVTFTPGPGCASAVGRQGGQQFIFLANGCSQGNTIHEIGHAVGLWHENSRADRDNNVRVNWANIINGAENNFRTYIETGQDGFDNGAYDFGSVMHYGSFFFSANGLPTLERLVGDPIVVAQRNGLSSGDIIGVNFMYPPACEEGATCESMLDCQPGGRCHVDLFRGTATCICD